MSWAAIVSGKGRHPPSVPTDSPPTNPPLPTSTKPHDNQNTRQVKNNQQKKSTNNKPSHQQQHPPQQSMWDDPRILVIYRLWTHHISNFMAQPVQFFHIFVINPQFRQSVFDAGLTFSPDTDPSNPVLINLNSTRFGMSERISALAPPATPDQRPPTQSPTPLPTLEIPPVHDPRQLHSPQHQSPHILFLSPAVCDLFEAARAATNTTGDLPNIPPTDHPLDLNDPPHLPNTPPDQIDALSHNLADNLAVSRPADVNTSRDSTKNHPNSSKASKKGRPGSNRHPNSQPADRRLAGRLKVVSRMRNVRIPSAPVCRNQTDTAKVEMFSQIEHLFPVISPPNDIASSRAHLLIRLRKIISDEWPDAGIDVYGSAGNGLGLRSADVDMSLYMPDSITHSGKTTDGPPHLAKDILARLATIMEDNNIAILSKLLEARVPVIKMHDPESKVQIDVCMNNILAVRNTELLKAYVDLDARFRSVCILVKLWAKRRDLNDAYRGTLSSYAYTLLVIHYLQTLDPVVLPCLQATINGKLAAPGVPQLSEMTDVGHNKLYNTYFDRSVTPATFKSANTSSICELLLGFFKYFAYTFQYRTDLASIRLGVRTTREERGWDEQSVYREWETKQAQFKAAYDVAKSALEARKKTDSEERIRLAKLKKERANGDSSDPQSTNAESSAKRERIVFPRRPRLESKHLFCIEDPFDIDHDLSRGMEKGAVTVIRQEMVRAYEILAETGDFESACEEWKDS